MAESDITAYCPEIHPGLSMVPLRNSERVGQFSSIVFSDADLVALYFDTGDLMEVLNLKSGRAIYPPKPEEDYVGLRSAARVYFVQSMTGEIKIGMATNIKSRLKSLQTANPSKLVLLAHVHGGPPQERAYHRQFAAHRLHGEWFSPHPDILAEIARLARKEAND